MLTSIDGVEFVEAWASKVEAIIDDLPVPVISKELLIRNKQAAARAQDAADLARISTEDQI